MNYLRRHLIAMLSMGSLIGKRRDAYAVQPFGSVTSGNDNKTTAGIAAQTQTMDKFSLSYELSGAGWAHAKVSMGSSTYETEVSDLTHDPLGLLAGALMGFIWSEESTVFILNRPGKKPLDPEDFKTRTFAWEDEPGGWKWTLRPDGPNLVKVKIEELAEKGAEPLINAIVPLRDMASACAMSIEALLIKHGIVGYQLAWTYGDLPLAQFLRLKRWLEVPGYVPKVIEGGTWKEDKQALRLIG